MSKLRDVWSQNAHFVISLLTALFLVCFQEQVLARLRIPWLHIDLVSIYVVYFSIEHFLVSSVIKIVVIAILMQAFSAAPMGFYFMYFMFALVISGFLSRRLVLYNRLSQLMTFSGIFILKYCMLFFVFKTREDTGFLADYFVEIFPTICSTIVATVPLFYLFSKIDEKFALIPISHRKREIEL